MKRTMQILVGMVGLLNFLIGLGFLFNPSKMATEFALSPLGTQGMATMRADFPAFFLTGAIFSLIGAWRADRTPLLVPLMLLIGPEGKGVELLITRVEREGFRSIRR